MQIDTIPLIPGAPGTTAQLRVLRFGTPGAAPKAYIQAALHADEVPGVLVAHRLHERLLRLEAEAALVGEVVLVPYANPLGMAQQLLGQSQGRFDLRDGINFNRAYPDLSDAAAAAVDGRWGTSASSNVALVRAALRDAASALPAQHPAQDLKRRLLGLAIDADVVLDLHCDSQAVMHLYALTPQEHPARELAALLGARALLLATESGDSPFDEACSRPWLLLQQRFPGAELPLACFGATVELRGEADTDHATATADADAIVEFLRRRGIVAGPPAALPAPACEATPLAGSEPIVAPQSGVVVFLVEPGAHVACGDTVAELVDADSGAVTPLVARSSGVLYARMAGRWAAPGTRVAKIAGTTLARTGRLLSP
jgi:predicted deacylase